MSAGLKRPGGAADNGPVSRPLQSSRPGIAAPLLLILASLAAGTGTACSPSDSGAPVSDAVESAAAGDAASSPAGALAGVWFTDRARELGIDFEHFNGMSGEFHLAEIMAPGAALFDMDNDGDLDAYLVQGRMLGAGKSFEDALIPPGPDVPLPLTDRLYRNDLEIGAGGSRTPRFTDVTEGSGLDVRSYGMGVAAADFDNDGWVDLYRTRLGANQLFRNNGDGTFRDVSRRAGVEDAGWGVSASFLDVDRDGWLDLYVGNYVAYSPEDEERCLTPTGERDYCAPKSYAAAPDRLYRNHGDGTFADVTGSAGIGREYGPALGVLGADFNADGWVDIYVANDGEPNQLWINRQDGTFRNGALLAGVAVDRGGDTEASMGVDAGDFDADGDDDLFMTHVTAETNTLYVNVGNGFFEDRSAGVGLGAPSMPYTGFGAAWADFDNDGWLDLLAVNGHVLTIESLAAAGDPFPLHQRNQLFRNLEGRGFEDFSDRAGPALRLSEVSRGAAFGDVDNDGDVDVLVANNNGPARLLVNEVGQENPWLGLRLVSAAGPRDAPGARVGVFRDAGPVLWRRARSDGSYASASDPRVVVGLGEAEAVTGVRVEWPSGRVEDWNDVPVRSWTTLTEGTGQAVRTGSR